jgi:hypothetical protein
MVSYHQQCCFVSPFLSLFLLSDALSDFKIWDLRSMRAPLMTARLASSANRIAMSPSTGVIAVPMDDSCIRLFDSAGARLARLPRRTHKVYHTSPCIPTYTHTCMLTSVCVLSMNSLGCIARSFLVWTTPCLFLCRTPYRVILRLRPLCRGLMTTRCCPQALTARPSSGGSSPTMPTRHEAGRTAAISSSTTCCSSHCVFFFLHLFPSVSLSFSLIRTCPVQLLSTSLGFLL